MDLRRERDIEQLRRVALAQQIQIEQLLHVLKLKTKELEALKGDPAELQQTLALLETLTKQQQKAERTVTATSPKKKPKDREKTGPTAQPRLPFEERVFELDEADRVCPTCGGELSKMAGQFEESEMIDVVEVSYRVVKVKQQKYACRCGACIETAPGPERAVLGGRYSLAFAIKVALDKYLDHIPLAPQERILRRHGLEISTQTLWDQLDALARRLRGIEAALFEHALTQPIIGLDQTGWPKLESNADKPWQMWCITAPGVVSHRIRDDKGAGTFKALVGGYNGVIVCDALKTHEAGARDGPGIVLAVAGHMFIAGPKKPRPIIRRLKLRLRSSVNSALMTPDDVGGIFGGAQQPRARHNVIFELGFFIGKLGAPKVCALVLRRDRETLRL